MKILLVSELIPFDLIGGLARHCITLGNQLLKMGHEVHMMGNADFRYDGNVDFKGRFITGFSLNWNLTQKIEKYTGAFPYPLYIHFSKQIADAIKEIATHYDVIHYHGHYPMVANFIPDSINFIQTRHDYGTVCPNKHFFRFSDKAVCTAFTPQDCAVCFKSRMGTWGRELNRKWISKWRKDIVNSISRRKTIFVSEKAKDISLKVLGISKASTVSVVHNFTDTKAIMSKLQKQAASKKNRSDRNNKVMIASTLAPPKGVYSFFRSYKNKGYNFPVTVAGRGSELPLIRSEFKDYPVTCIGWLSHEDTLNLMLLHQVFTATSLLEEPCPTTILEAMFLKKSIFALQRGGIPELKVYSLYESQVNLYDSMEELVDGIANHLANPPTTGNIDFTDTDFGACVSKKALEIISVYNL
ncbi:glycosyltransferase [candidate division WS5 bacterium]|uniref:Glycosyltransferase n=1 Tax=candidate division WS5 bacterium TaxID=2093353 RepID=A0A419DDP2_9BACT|nr:MAG: glycosyltransferase [candidate division WS5 bacterium]